MDSNEIDDTAYFRTLRAEQAGGPPPMELNGGATATWTIETNARYISPHFWRAVGVIRLTSGEVFYDYDLPEQFTTERHALEGGRQYALDWIAQQPV
ncbi:hypothetical protein QCE63_34515 [Caballeronia sp. LZ065]|uniref:hypothetical protein n=1 Tax=Caballeronia sp. LZ065 TaxID=3038571 RepID=UPI00285E527F|nr:hypothetical protein [Caballeronia sp. LZ065]MDR5784521.1 hypothetical protein [Caballeronia sp. LZ065]